MMFWENLKMAGRSIAGNKLRTLLTTLGIIIGVGSVSAVIAIGNGVKSEVTKQVSSFGANLLQVNPGAPSSDGRPNFAASLGTSTLTEKDAGDIKALGGVEASAPAMIVSGVATAGGKSPKGGYILATSSDFPRAVNQDWDQGRFFNDDTNEVVLGGDAAEDLFGDKPIGKKLTIRDQTFTVVGVFKKPDPSSLQLGPGLGSIIYIPLATGKVFNNGNANINEIDIKAKSADQVGSVKDEIKRKLKANHGNQEDFTVLDAKEQLDIFGTILNILTSFVSAIAGISLLVGGIGIMNIMLVSVTERTREIGLRKAIGASSRTVLGQFLIEAVSLTLLGGALGLAFAWLLGLLVKHFAKLQPVFTLEAILTAIVISTVVGIVFGLAPAIKAARMKPIDALRYE
jgi:putative ABC transport system permease protein